MRRAVWFAVAVAILAGACGLVDRCEAKKKKGGKKRMQLQVTSTAFTEGGKIPPRCTADGADVSPQLKFGGIPAGAKSVAVICDDPDAPRGTWAHWVLYNLPATTNELPEHVPAQPTLENGARQGINDFGTVGYRGPAPPSGTHRYFFKVYALKTMLDLPPRATKAQLIKTMNGHIIAQGELMGKYSRK